MKTSVLFLLLPIAVLSGCTMEPPKQPGLGPYPFITESFDFINSGFNRAAFNAQRSAWQERDYKNYSYVLHLSKRNAGEDLEDPWEVYECKVVVEEGKDPELTVIEGVPPEDRPSVYTMDGMYDYVFSLMENLERRVKEENEYFKVYIKYDPLHNILLEVSIQHLENGFWESFRNMYIDGISPPKVTEEVEIQPSLYAFDRETFEQEYNAWKGLGIKNYSYFLYTSDSRLNESESAHVRLTMITVQDGKEPQVSGGAFPLADYTIDGVFDFISSAVEDPSSFGLEFFLAYSPEYHIPTVVMAAAPGDYRQAKLFITLTSFAILP